MKRILALVICLCTLFSFVSCSSAIATEETVGEKNTVTAEKKTEVEAEKEKKEIKLPDGFSAGFATKVVNPEEGVFLGGFPGTSTRVNETIEDDIVLSCIAVCDGTNVFFYFSMDATQIGQSISDRVGKIANELFGIPAENVIMNATHTHSGPGLYSSGASGVAQYMKKVFYPAVEILMEQALGDLGAATLRFGTSDAEGMNYVRRYVSKVDGSYLGKNIASGQDPDKVAHETDSDSMIRTLRFAREGKKDIILCNWQCHPCTAGVGSASATKASSDWLSTFRTTVEETEDVHFIYMQGAAGNLANSSKIQGENSFSDYRAFGKKLAPYVSLSMQNEKEIATGDIQIKKENITLEYSAEYLKDNNVGKKHTISLWAISFGGVGIATLPGELHDSLGVALREKSPYDATLFSGYTNGTSGYFAADFAYDNGGYEVQSSRHEKGTSEEMVAKLVSMLQELYQTKQ